MSGQYESYDGVALFSGGLDSILAARTVQDQGLKIKCLHFVTPFFGKPHKLEQWRVIYGLDIEAVDIGEDYARLMAERPAHGFGKALNPCVDCKILMLTRARELMEHYGAQFIVSGEVVGQRPMSQRRDAMNLIAREAGVKELLLRPLCAKNLDETPVETSGLVDRERLLAIYGRGRKEQLRLAKEIYRFEEIPTPAGGCMLAEMESAKRYWPLLAHPGTVPPAPSDFELANTGRQFWDGPRWLCVGRNKDDNQTLGRLAREGDVSVKTLGYPGPLALIRPLGPSAGGDLAGQWSAEDLARAAALVAYFSPKARKAGQAGEEIRVSLRTFTGPVRGAELRGGPRGEELYVDGPFREETLTVTPLPPESSGFAEPDWEAAREEKKAEEARARQAAGK